MICPEFSDPKYLFFADGVSPLVYYSHFSSLIVALLIGFFVYFKDRKALLNKLLFSITIIFALWVVLSLITWTNNSSGVIMFDWSMDGIVYSSLCLLTLYFFYVFVDKRDIDIKKKIIFLLLLSPLIVFTSTKFNLSEFNLTVCGIFKEGQYFTNYYYGLGFFVFLWIFVLGISRYRKAEKEFKRQLLVMIFGVEFFLLAFFVAGFLASYLVDSGLMSDFSIDQYGLFGMTFFMGMLAYLIVKFKAFHIKLLGAQALVVSLVILIASEFFFIPIDNVTNVVLISVTVLFSVIFGMWLIDSVKKEVERKEQLQAMADKLASANDQLRVLDNAKTEFISIASHQLRTPITAIKGFTSLILEGSFGEISKGVQGAVEKVYSSSERLVTLIEDLLNVSRIESGRMTFAFENSSIEKLLKELYENFILVAKNKKFYLDLKLPKEPMPEIKMDYTKIRELASNFIDNALKYTEKGGVTVSAEVRDEGVLVDDNGFVIPEKKSPYGKVARITVSDTGIGIPKEEIPYLFRKFSRGKDVKRLHVGGTGLGLYVGKAIADAHHGQTWVESDGAGKGSRFIIEIPLDHQD